MGYCFMHTEKVKTFSNMNARYRHNYRTVEVKNADRSLIDQNHEIIPLPCNADGSQMSYREAWKKRLGELDYYKTHTIRKNAVLAYEVVTTFSRNRLNEMNIEEWKKENAAWIEKTFSVAPDGRSNVMSMVYHGDEAGNVHCHAMIIPIDENGKLNAKRFTGEPAQLSKMQSSYARDMGKFGLRRGIQNSRAKHTDIKRFYAALNRSIEAPDMHPGEHFGDYIERTKDYIRTQMAAVYKRELDERRKGQETLAKQRELEQAAIRKELEATQQQAAELISDLYTSTGTLERKKACIEKELVILHREQDKLRKENHRLEAALGSIQETLWKAGQYDRIAGNLDALVAKNSELAGQIRAILFRDNERSDTGMEQETDWRCRPDDVR